MSDQNELATNYDVLCKRIAALDRDITLELDRERRTVLEERRAELAEQRDGIGAQLALSSWRTDGQDSTVVTQQMMDASLRGLDAKMDRLIDQVHDIDTRQKLLEAQVGDLRTQIGEARAQIAEVRNQVIVTRSLTDPDISRVWLLAGGLSVLLALVMLVIITWRVM